MPVDGYTSKKRVHDRYKIIGFISSGTYGKVYKAIGINGQVGEFAIKKSARPPTHAISIQGRELLSTLLTTSTRIISDIT